MGRQLYLQPNVRVAITSNKQLDYVPHWYLEHMSLILGPFNSVEEHIQNAIQTIGSGSGFGWWPDEFRFNSDTKLLESLWLSVPETNLADISGLEKWLVAPRFPG